MAQALQILVSMFPLMKKFNPHALKYALFYISLCISPNFCLAQGTSSGGGLISHDSECGVGGKHPQIAKGDNLNHSKSTTKGCLTLLFNSLKPIKVKQSSHSNKKQSQENDSNKEADAPTPSLDDSQLKSAFSSNSVEEKPQIHEQNFIKTNVIWHGVNTVKGFSRFTLGQENSFLKNILLDSYFFKRLFLSFQELENTLSERAKAIFDSSHCRTELNIKLVKSELELNRNGQWVGYESNLKVGTQEMTLDGFKFHTLPNPPEGDKWKDNIENYAVIPIETQITASQALEIFEQQVGQGLHCESY